MTAAAPRAPSRRVAELLLVMPAFPQVSAAQLQAVSLAAEHADAALTAAGGGDLVTACDRGLAAVHAGRHAVPADDRFWTLATAVVRDALAALELERAIAGGRRLDDATGLALARGRAAVPRLALRALAAAGGEPADAALADAIDAHALVGQLLDELVQWRRDRAAGRPTLALAHAGGDDPPDDVGRRLYYDGHAERVLGLAVAALDRAAPAVAGRPLAGALAALRGRCEATRADVAAIVARNRARGSARPALDLPAATGDRWLDLARDAASYVVDQWRAGFGEVRHQARFSADMSREVVAGDVFQRALIADALCDLPAPWPQALAPMLTEELAYLRQARVCPDRGWSYYPALAELPPDADLLAQVLQVAVRVGGGAAADDVDAPIRAAIEDGDLGDGSFATWLLPPPAARTPLHHAQAALVGAPAADAEVVANLIYALALHDRARYATAVTRGATWLAGQQRAAGDWAAAWYQGSFYSTYAAVRALAHLGGAPAALHAAARWLTEGQQPDGGWGRDGLGNALDTAHAMLALAAIDAAQARPALERGRDFLAAAAAAGWSAVPFIHHGERDERPFGSRTLTAAYVAQAAARCRP